MGNQSGKSKTKATQPSVPETIDKPSFHLRSDSQIEGCEGYSFPSINGDRSAPPTEKLNKLNVNRAESIVQVTDRLKQLKIEYESKFSPQNINRDYPTAPIVDTIKQINNLNINGEDGRKYSYIGDIKPKLDNISTISQNQTETNGKITNLNIDRDVNKKDVLKSNFIEKDKFEVTIPDDSNNYQESFGHSFDNIRSLITEGKSPRKDIKGSRIEYKESAKEVTKYRVIFKRGAIKNASMPQKKPVKSSRLDSNVVKRYSSYEIQNLRGNWEMTQYLDTCSLWENVVALDDPILITLKIVRCLHEVKNLQSLHVKDMQTLVPMSIALEYVSRCKLIYHKSRIASDMLQPNILERIRILINNQSKNTVASLDVLEVVRNLFFFYEDIILYQDQILAHVDTELLLHFLEECQFLCLKFSSQLLNVPFGFSNRMDFMINKVRNKDFNTFNSCYPTNIFEINQYAVSIEKGAYKSVHGYVKTHFALMKEDFQQCLRTGLIKYLEGDNTLTESCLEDGNTPTDSYLDIYENVTIRPHYAQNRFSYVIEFPDIYIRKFRYHNWTTSNKFLFGSLILLSTDNFRTYLLAKVDDRESIERSSHQLNISLLLVPDEIDLNCTYLMAESKTYFFPYCLVMKVLRNMPKYRFPFQKYIVFAESETKPPSYLPQGACYTINDHSVVVSDRSTYPKPEKLGLNKYQLDALFTALNNELSLVQGPPGTGKTFMCRQIIQTLLNNKQYWTHNYNTPIVVVCYKNLSLDELLEGLLKDGVKVLRIGSCTKSEELSTYYSLGGMESPKDAWSITWSLGELKLLMQAVKNEIADNFFILSSCQDNEGVIKFSAIAGAMEPEEVTYLHKIYLKWLFGVENEDLVLKSRPKSNYDLCDKSIAQRILECKSLKMVSNANDPAEEITLLNKVRNDLKALLRFNFENVPAAKLSQLANVDIETVTDVKDRWILYYQWIKKTKMIINDSISGLTRRQSDLTGRLSETFNLFDARKIAQSNIEVIGITTTAAARLNVLLDELKPKIVIVEEAAEVLESHCITAINEHCEHVILFGDHKQLRPLTASADLGTRCNMSISLFERLSNNGLVPSVLNIQYRMRPEISALISPTIYEHLENAANVEAYDDVKGVAKNVFFLHHTNTESLGFVKSFYNQFEVNFSLHLAFYLINQGYSPERITIISAYGEQDRMLNKKRKDMCNPVDSRFKLLEKVVIATVDSYQGKENDIVILSLVRNNNNGKVGFLKTENRICVALSRAKIGLYILGNLEMLAGTSLMWNQIRDILQTQNGIGSELKLVCQMHKTATYARSDLDMERLKYGGCNKLCKAKLECNHTCKYVCHGVDVEHKKEFACSQKCLLLLDCGDRCELYCHNDDVEHVCAIHRVEESELASSSDTESLGSSTFISDSESIYSDSKSVEITDLGAVFRSNPDAAKTSNNKNNAKLRQFCGFKLKCGHLCQFQCHLLGKGMHQEALKCKAKCEMSLSCRHICQMDCHNSSHVGQYRCKSLCKQKLVCGHKCTFPCHSSDRDHSGIFACVQPCLNMLPCKHSCTFDCHILEDPAHKSSHACISPCNMALKCGHTCERDCHILVDPNHNNKHACKTCFLQIDS